VWFTILVQLSSYINAHAEEMRSMLVAHNGKKKLVIEYNDLYSVDWAKFAYDITKMIEKEIVDPSLR